MTTISDYVRQPHNGEKPEYLVIYFHGYGSSGALMEQYVGDLLGPMLPEAELRFPDAPIQMGWDNHSWFELRDIIDNTDVPTMHKTVAARAAKAAAAMNAYIDRAIKESGIPEDRVIIAGFSQGGTMAFYTGMMRATKVAGVFALSGGALDHIPQINSDPPVALVAGGREQQHYSGAPHAEKTRKFLDKKGIFVESVIVPDQGHETSPAAMRLLSQFTRIVTADFFKTKTAITRKKKVKPGRPRRYAAPGSKNKTPQP